MARPGGAGRVGGVRLAGAVERAREYRLEGFAGGAGRLVPDRLGGPGHCHLAGRRRDRGAGIASPTRPRRSVACQERSAHRRAAAGGRAEWRGVPLSRSLPPDGRGPIVGAPPSGFGRVSRVAREAQPRDANAGHGWRTHLRLVRQRATCRSRHGGRCRLDAASRRGVFAFPESLGARQLTHAPPRLGHPPLRPSTSVLPAGAPSGRARSAGKWTAAGDGSRTPHRWSCPDPAATN